MIKWEYIYYSIDVAATKVLKVSNVVNPTIAQLVEEIEAYIFDWSN